MRYSHEPHIRHVVALREGEQEWCAEMSLQWLPDSAATTELVACVEEKERYTIEVCSYVGSDATRYGYRRRVRLLSALTGEEVASQIFKGDPPRECPASERVNLTELKAEDVTFADVRDWLGSAWSTEPGIWASRDTRCSKGVQP